MPKIQESLNKVGNVVKFEAHASENLAREEKSVTFAKADSSQMQVGEVLIEDGANFRELVSGDTAGLATANLAVLIDDRIEELTSAASGATVTAATMVDIKAPVTLRSGGLGYGADAGNARTAIIARLEALGFKVAESYAAL